MFNCEASKQASGLGLMLSAKIYILSWKVWNKTFYCGSQTRIIADYTRNQIVFMRPLTYQNPVSKRVYFILWNKTSLNRRCVEHFEIDYYLIKRNTLVAWHHLEIPRRWSKNEWQKRLLEGESISHKTGNCKLWMNNSGDGSVEKKRSCQRCHQFWYRNCHCSFNLQIIFNFHSTSLYLRRLCHSQFLAIIYFPAFFSTSLHKCIVPVKIVIIQSILGDAYCSFRVWLIDFFKKLIERHQQNIDPLDLKAERCATWATPILSTETPHTHKTSS